VPDDVLDLRYPAPTPPSDLASKARAKARRRKAWQTSVAAIGVAGVVGAVLLNLPSDDRPNKLNVADGTPTAEATPAVLPPSVPRPVLHPRTGPTAGPDGQLPGLGAPVTRPDAFIAFTPGGAERPTLVRTDGGHTIRVLGPGAQVVGVLSPDKQTLYLPVTETGVGAFGCDARWQAISVADASSVPAPGLDGLADFALSPDGTTIATTVSPDGCGHPGDGDAQRLVVRPLAGGTGSETPLPAGNWFLSGWSAGTLLLNDVGSGSADTYATFDATTLDELSVLPAPPAGCEAGAANLRGSDDVVMAQTCTVPGGKRIDLVDLDPSTGRELRRVKVHSGGNELGRIFNGLGVDRSGQNVILQSSVNDGRGDGHVYLVLDSTVVDQGLTGVFGAAW
jgi:hypothetical protein